MTIQIRLLGAGDAAVLDNVAEEVFDNDVIPEQAARYLADPSHYLAVAIDDGIVVGMCSGNDYLHPDKPVQFWVNELGVAPSHQRRGIGKRLFLTILDAARRNGRTEAWVGTEDENTAARALYRSAGGREAPFRMYTFDLVTEGDA